MRVTVNIGSPCLKAALHIGLVSLAASAAPALAANDSTVPASSNPLYRLVAPELALPGAGSQLGGFRLETFTSLAPRHEVRLSAEPVPALPLSAFDPWGSRTFGADSGLGLGTTRATYRYVVSQSPDWAWKVGITANLREMSESLRAAASLTPPRFGGLPYVHLAGEGRFGTRWSLAFDADGLVTPRGRALDLGVRVDYALTRTFSLYGGYRLNEATGEAEDPVASALGSSARFGVRYRF
jgi:hypothetical protein